MKVFTLSILLISSTLLGCKPTPNQETSLPQLHVIFAMEHKGVEYGRLNMENDTLMRNFVETIQRGLKYPMQIHRLGNNNFSSNALEDTIAALTTTPEDIVIVYYSGYGISPSDTTKKFANWRLHDEKGFDLPFFSHWRSKGEAEKGLPVSDVEKWLKDKNIHLGLLIADCITDTTMASASETHSRYIDETVDMTAAVMQQLFIKTTGIVRLGSSPLTTYYPGHQPGTFFTWGLREGLDNLINTINPDRLYHMSFEDLRRETSIAMGLELPKRTHHRHQQAAIIQQEEGVNHQEVPVLEMKNWDGKPLNIKNPLNDTIPINARWQGFIVNDSAYERLAKKMLDKSIKQFPSVIDLSKYAPKVLNQGNRGNCVAISIGYYMRSMMEAIRLNLSRKEDINKLRFSPFYLYQALKEPNDENCTFGIDAGRALKFLREKGLPRFSDISDDCAKRYSVPIDSDSRIKDYVKLFNINDPKESKVLAVKQALAEMSPVVVGIQTTSSLQNLRFTKTIGTRLKASVMELKSFITNSEADRNRSSLNLSYDAYKAKELAFGHALCVVGYDSAMLGNGAFKIINSWGSSWGNDGYFWMSYDEFGKFAKYGYQAYLDNSHSAIRLDIDLTITKGSLRKEPKFNLSMPKDSGLATYTFTEPLQTDSQLKFRFDARKQTYVYLITGSSSDNKVSLNIPKLGNDVVIAPNSRAFYPSDTTSLILKGQSSIDYMLFLFSDSKIDDINALVKKMNSNKSPFPDRVMQTFDSKMIRNRQIEYKPKKMGFFLPQNDQVSEKVVPLLVTINHVH